MIYLKDMKLIPELVKRSCSLPSIEMKRERVLHVLHARVVLHEKQAELHASEAVISLWQSPFH